EPYFYQGDPRVDDVAFSRGANLQKMFMLTFVDKPHHVFDARPVVPTSIEDDDLAGGGKVRNVALNIHLALFTISRRRQSDTRKTRGLTRSVMALIVPPLPAASRPSNRTMILAPSALTQSCNRQSST